MQVTTHARFTFCQNIMLHDKFIAPQRKPVIKKVKMFERENFQRKIKKHEFEGEQGNACLKLIIRAQRRLFSHVSPRTNTKLLLK